MYAKASKPVSNTGKVLKIKDTFLSLQTKKIKNIQKIINGSSKPKPYINMTIKGSSRKQVIVPMNSENIKKFMDESSSHVSNLNRAFKNIKLETMVKIANYIDSTGVKVLYLS